MTHTIFRRIHSNTIFRQLAVPNMSTQPQCHHSKKAVGDAVSERRRIDLLEKSKLACGFRDKTWISH